MAEYPWRPLGELLVERGLIDEYALEPLLLEQRLTGQLLGELLVAKRIVSPMELAAILGEQHGVHLDPERRPKADGPPALPRGSGARRFRPLGRILVEKELLTESGLQRVLLAQRRTGGSLGQLVVERGYVTPDELAEALADQHGLDVDPKALREAEPEPVHEPEPEAVFEVLLPPGSTTPLFVASSFLEATDFAFELLYADDPEALEIVRVSGDGREQAWSYTRQAAEEAAAELDGSPVQAEREAEGQIDPPLHR
jgi:hypothetical protein